MCRFRRCGRKAAPDRFSEERESRIISFFRLNDNFDALVARRIVCHHIAQIGRNIVAAIAVVFGSIFQFVRRKICFVANRYFFE